MWVVGVCVVLGALLLGLVAAALAARFWVARALEDVTPDDRDEQAVDGTGLPEGHRPPPGLGPLSPSERFLTSEASRGIRDLERWLVDAA